MKTKINDIFVKIYVKMFYFTIFNSGRFIVLIFHIIIYNFNIVVNIKTVYILNWIMNFNNNAWSIFN